MMSMFSMPQNSYPYGTAPVATRNFAAHGTSSAFSSSAHPDEDWTKISDLAERRRIQNRIAQRNYRKKLKRRLEDLEQLERLERRTGSSEEAEPDKKRPLSAGKGNKRQSLPKTQKSQAQAQAQAPAQAQPQPTPPKSSLPRSQFTPPMDQNDDVLFNTTPVFLKRERSGTPPSLFSYASCPSPDDLVLDPYAATQAYPTMASATEPYPTYLTSNTIPATLPSMTHFSDALKRDTYPGEDSLSSYLGYGYVPGLEIGIPSHFDAVSAHVSRRQQVYQAGDLCH